MANESAAARTLAGGVERGARADQWGGRPVPLSGAVGLLPAPPRTAVSVALPLGARGDRAAAPIRLRGRAAGGQRAAVLAELPPSSQRVVVMSAAGGSGRSVVAAGIALACARHRGWPLVAVDAAEPSFNALAARFGADAGPTILDVVPLLDQARAGNQLGAYVRRVRTDRASRGQRGDGEGARPGEVHVLAAPGPRRPPLDAATMGSVLARLATLYPTVVVDCPPGTSGAYQQAALAGATTVVMVAPAREDDVRRAGAMAALVRQMLAGSVPILGVVVAARPGGWNRAAAAAEPVLGAHCVSLVRLGWDVALAGGAPVTEVGPAAAATLEEIAAITVAMHSDARAAPVKDSGATR